MKRIIKIMNQKRHSTALLVALVAVLLFPESGFAQAPNEQQKTDVEKRQLILELVNEAHELGGVHLGGHESTRLVSQDIQQFLQSGCLDRACELADSDEQVSHSGEMIIREYARRDRFDEALAAIERLSKQMNTPPSDPGFRNSCLIQCLIVASHRNQTDLTKQLLERIDTSVDRGEQTLLQAHTIIANDMIESGDSQKALEFIKQHVDPLPPRTQYSIARVAMNNGHVEWALPLISGSVDKKSRLYSVAFQNLIERREFQKAFDLATESLDEFHGFGIRSLARVAATTGDEANLDEIWQMVKTDPESFSKQAITYLANGYFCIEQNQKAFEVLSFAGEQLVEPNKSTFTLVQDVFARTESQDGRMAALELFESIKPEWLNVRMKTEFAMQAQTSDPELAKDLTNEIRQQLPNLTAQDLAGGGKPTLCFLLLDQGHLEDGKKVLEAFIALDTRDFYRQQVQFRLAHVLIEQQKVDEACEFLAGVTRTDSLSGASMPVVATIARLKDVETAMEILESAGAVASDSENVLRHLFNNGYDETARQWLLEMNKREGPDHVVFRSLARSVKRGRRMWKLDDDELGRLEPVFEGYPGLLGAIAHRWIDRANFSMAIRTGLEYPEWWKTSGGEILKQIAESGLLMKFLKANEALENKLEIHNPNFLQARHFLLAGDSTKAIQFTRSIDGVSRKRAMLFDCARQLDSPWLENLRRIETWIASNLVDDGHGGLVIRSQGKFDDEVSNPNFNLYSGMAGVSLFYRQMSTVTRDRRYRNINLQIARGMDNQLARVTSGHDPGLFTGYTGVAFAHGPNHSRRSDRIYEKVVQLLEQSATNVPNDAGVKAITWNNTTDQISGAAGIGNFLLRYRTEKQSLAIPVGEGLLAMASAVELSDGSPGLKWRMTPTFEREMPNYSHGTAGVCRFLLDLDEYCFGKFRRRISPEFDGPYDGRFGKAAQKGLNYLADLNSLHGGRGLLPHHFPGGEELIYLGWCHGPPGTCQLANQVVDLKGIESWREWSQLASEELLKAELHKNRTDGFWNNVGICCGSAGVGSFLLDQSVRFQEPRYLYEAQRIAADILNRGQHGETDEGLPTLCWPSAEHRVRPELIEIQIGLMQGAAGIGLFLLQMETQRRGGNHFSIFEDLF